jgi:translation initiation factor 1 (eIF-1/SUI1)
MIVTAAQNVTRPKQIVSGMVSVMRNEDRAYRKVQRIIDSLEKKVLLQDKLLTELKASIAQQKRSNKCLTKNVDVVDQ